MSVHDSFAGESERFVVSILAFGHGFASMGHLRFPTYRLRLIRLFNRIALDCRDRPKSDRFEIETRPRAAG